jgi:hypothetical protein
MGITDVGKVKKVNYHQKKALVETGKKLTFEGVPSGRVSDVGCRASD